jgi:hypothetical protein
MRQNAGHPGIARIESNSLVVLAEVNRAAELNERSVVSGSRLDVRMEASWPVADGRIDGWWAEVFPPSG